MQKNIIYENIITLIVSIENISKAKTIIIPCNPKQIETLLLRAVESSVAS